MSRIKCRYYYFYCSLANIIPRYDCESDNGCECGFYEDNSRREFCNGKSVYVYDELCKHLTIKYAEFEKTVKRYEYNDGDLRIGKHIYLKSDIEYLEIDGRVLVKEEESE